MGDRMKYRVRAVSAIVGATLTGMVWTGVAWAEPSWVQLEAKSSLAEARDRAADWAGSLPDVAGFQLGTGWYAIALGPFDTAEAAETARQLLRGERIIPSDAFVTQGERFRGQFWPIGANLAPPVEAPATAAPEPAPAPAPETAAAPEPAPQPVETLAESRRLEAALARDERRDIQAALEWAGFYEGTLDGLFGRGTRASITAWQEAQGFEPTGFLASAQQRQLFETVAAEKAAYGFETIDEPEAGIRVTLPMALVEFDHYDPPFVHYRAKDGSGLRILLISQQGDQADLFGLYDAMQTLEIVPVAGERSRDRTSFTLTGQNAKLHSHSEAQLKSGLIKGFTLAYPADQEARMARVLAAMQQSFEPTGTKALDDTLGKPLAVSGAALMAGLNVRQPVAARSGFWLTEAGAVLTAAEGFDVCKRVTIEDHAAEIAFSDPALGIAVLTSTEDLAPAAIAHFQSAPPAPGAAIAVAGFSYPETLSAPVLSFGTLSALSGLAGETDRARLAVTTLPGDAGGPVLDGSGSVIGLLLPAPSDATRLLPPDLSIAVPATLLTPALTQAGFSPAPSENQGALAAEDIAEIAQELVVQVACWN
ncbi:trypsin-like peptidase domain-containing protein [Pseudothioclava arenosa]|nr:trypsin-like peptidase domain-containing protein [Pseudothioclava arenosa]